MIQGQFPCNLDKQSHGWLKFEDIKGETEGVKVAAQDRAIDRKCFKNKILKEEIDSRCRFCKQYDENAEHLTSGCPILAKGEYRMRHDKVSAHLHYSVCKTRSIENTDKRYTRARTHTQTTM